MTESNIGISTSVSQQLSAERPRRSAEEIDKPWPLFSWWYHAPRNHFDIWHITSSSGPLSLSKALAQPRWVCIARDDPPPELIARVMERITVLIAGRPLPSCAYNLAGARAFHNQRVLLIELPVQG